MEINFDTVLLNLLGEELTQPEKEDSSKQIPVFLKSISIDSLMGTLERTPNSKPETGVEKMKRYELAKRISKGGIIKVTAEEITLIKERIGLAYGTMVVGSAYNIIEKTK